MNRARRTVAVLVAATALAGALTLLRPSPPAAEANIGCSVATAPAGVITGGIGKLTGGAIGGGNPVGDACNAVTDGAVGAVTSPITSAIDGVASGIFGQVTSWVAEGTTYLMGQVVAEIDKTTTPKLTTEGFLEEYGRMAQVASILAAAMFVMALLEAVIQESWAILGRAIFVSVPLAFVGTSVAFVLVQLMLVVTDGMSHAVSVATQEDSTRFFKTSITDLAKAGGRVTGAAAEATGSPGAGTVAEVAGTTSAVAGPAPTVPLFVTFVAAIVGAFAAFAVWFELWLRDASVYVVVLFMPLAAAASISPRWAHVLRRYIELIVTVIGSKFVIVSVVALAASLASEKEASFEHIIAAAALLLVACFVPALFFRLVLTTEGAVSSALNRRGLAGGAMVMAQIAGGPQGFAHMARSNWQGPQVWNVAGGGAGSGGGGSGAPSGGSGPTSGGGGGGGSGHPGGTPSAGDRLGPTGGGSAAGRAGPTGAAPIVAGAEAAASGAQATSHALERTSSVDSVGSDSHQAPVAGDAGGDGSTLGAPMPVDEHPASGSIPLPSSSSPPAMQGGGVGGRSQTHVEVPEPTPDRAPGRSPAESTPRPPQEPGPIERSATDG